MNGGSKGRVDVLAQIRNPLIFFSLALLMIEGIIGLVIGTSTLTEKYTFYSICIMAFLFLVVVGLVAWITIKWPQHLYEEISQKLKATDEIKEFINSQGFLDIIEEYLQNRPNSDHTQ